MPVNLRSLIEKLNDTVRSGLEAAAGLCVARTHYEVEIEHYLMKLLEATDSDFARIARHYGVDTSQLSKELTRSLDRMKRGNARGPALSQWLVRMLTEAWTIATLDFNAGQIRSGFTILALRTHDDLLRLVNEVSREFQKIQGEDLRKNFATIVAGSPEEAAAVAAAAPAAPARAAPGKTPNLDQYTIDLTERARAGKLDPVLGRDFEIRQIIDILMRRRQNNPILTGEAGVGKTAVVEGFAQRVVQGDVPAPLRNVSVRALDLALLQAGAGIKGEFENRLKGLIEEVKASPQPIILFIDEAHTLIGAGGQAGLSDAANLLKPALARGELRTIAATTWSEYKKYFEKDAALARRFQVVKVDEPGEEQCMVMLRGIVGALEKHHNVRILDEAVRAAVRLSHRYLAGRQLPDKAVSVLDTACARLALGQAATPPAIEDVQRRLDDLRVQKRVLEREAAVGADHAERLRAIESEIPALEERLRRLTERWERERNLVERIRELRAKLEAMAGAAPARVLAAAGGDGKAGVQEEVAGEAVTAPSDGAAALRAELESLSRELAELQGDEPLMQVCVDAQIVSEVISAWTGIPVGKMVKDELQTLLSLERVLGERIIGQDHALKVISERIVSSRASMDDPNKPVGVFLLVGPSGVGKTETALVLSDLLYGGERNLITINMSEFQEAHTVSTLKGAPPGYVGYGEGGVLTEAVRRRPYSVVLLDEVEKAHPDVLELFYQVFDKGVMEDGEGREIDFKNTIIMLTTNACSDAIMKLCADPETAPSPEALVRAIKPELNKIFKPAFLGRLVIVPYYPLRDEALRKIIELKLGKIQRRIRENHRIEFSYDPSLVEEVARRCTEVESGARNVDNILTNTLLPDISRQLLARMAEGEKLSLIHAGVGEDGAFTYRFA
ncbi:MAG: type VI secretion system ATPase TssH [Bryobacterales bacterium]|nr:type VI secretion system ATPase TssH [Bryobacterales bacterium]